MVANLYYTTMLQAQAVALLHT